MLYEVITPRAGQMDDAIVGDGAFIDGGVVEGEPAGVVDGDLPAGVVDGAALIDAERAARQHSYNFV